MSLMDLLYWFGGKRPMRNEIIPFLTPLIEDVREFREPFCGSAAIALPLMSLYPNRIFWLNDRDPAVACVWFAVKHYPDQLIELVGSFPPLNVKIFDGSEQQSLQPSAHLQDKTRL